MLKRVMEAIEAFFTTGDGWSLIHYGLIVAFALMVFALVMASYGIVRHVAYVFKRRHQLNEWKKAKKSYESGTS